MGLIKKALGIAKEAVAGVAGNLGGNAWSSLSSVVKDQYPEIFLCDNMGSDILAVRSIKRDKNGYNKGNDNIISNGSLIIVNAGQCAILVDNGKIT